MESILHMDSKLYNAAITGDISILGQNKDQIGVQSTPDKKTALHLASQLGQTEAVKLILSMHPYLISEVNSFGETALHLGTRGGHTSVVEVLIDYAKKLDDKDIESRPLAWQFILWTANVDGETVLHEAARYKRPRALRMLVKQDPSYSHSANKMGETPLYIAARRGFDEVVDVILESCDAPVYSGPNGSTALHGAVVYGREGCTRKLLRWKKTLVTETDLIGNTPLHYAAQYGRVNIAKQLLKADASVAYITDKKHSETALHTAAAGGHVSVMAEILLHCPDTCGMVDKYGRNMLHLAVGNNEKKVVQYILDKCPVISSLINQKDENGNTPTHLLALSDCHVLDSPKLIRHAMIDEGAFNNKNLTPLGQVYENKNTRAKDLIEIALKSFGGMLSVDNATKRELENQLMNKEAAPDPYERERKSASTHIIVAALIATVTFAAGFTMPGGYIQSGSENQGMIVLTKSVAFKAFIIFDTLALVLSLSAVFLQMLTYTYVKQFKVPLFLIIGYVFTNLALIAMMIAFVTGTYAVLAHSSALAIAICLLGCTFFLIYFSLRYFYLT